MIVRFSFKTAFIILVTATLTVFGLINSVQKARYVTPDDGCGWNATARGVEAYIVERRGPAERAGIQRGDILEAIGNKKIATASDVSKRLYELGVWSKATYSLRRGATHFTTTVIVAPQDTHLRFKRFLEFVGFLYLFIGVFIFLRRWQAAGALHFYAICIVSFVVYAFSHTNKFNDFDWTIYWLDEFAFLFLPPLFLHFCLSFPERKNLLRSFPLLVAVVYLPAVVLALVQILFVSGGLNLLQAPLSLRVLLDKIHTLHFAILFLLGVVSLCNTYATSSNQILKQQMKWIVIGTTLGAFPFFFFYALPFWFGVIPTFWMEATVFPLVFIPLTFGYAIIKYRLMDVDIIFKRGVASTLASLAVVGFYFGLIAFVSEVFRASGASRVWVIISIIVAAFIFSPLRNWIQVKVDKYFYRERYNYRQTLIEFGRTLGAEVNLRRLLDTVVERLNRTLSVDKIALFLANEEGKFRLGKSVGTMPSADELDLSFLDPQRPALTKGYLFYENLRTLVSESPQHREILKQLDLNYYLPCVTKGQTIAFIGLGRTTRGELLTSEDVELLLTIAGYVAIAIENSRLYESIQEKAEELRRLKDYNESIVESISVGVVVLGLDDRIEGWNTRMESLMGVGRAQAIGTRLADHFPKNLIDAIHSSAHGSSGAFQLYKFPLRLDSESLVADITLTPLFGRSGHVSGQLIILDDKTERVKMEDQLIESEKLTSIGLLAAGVAHEVNTPLAVVSSYSQMLYKQLHQDDPKAKILDKIIKQSFRASEIVNSLLNFSRTSGSEFRLVDLHAVVSDTLSLLEHQFKTSKVRIKREFGSSVPQVLGNPGKLQQVFLNLFINAKDAMPDGGELLIKTSSQDSIFRVEVVDTGVGIAEEHLKKVYDPFFTTKELGRGTGLGLSVTYGIIQEHSGKIAVDSKPGYGTRFTLEFPAARKVANV
ncbi:MAG: PAS domain S-box protein [Acidimicrobiia bacterium]|nr:PAS domain S-box protein [Acidimicrobiia bacterium]